MSLSNMVLHYYPLMDMARCPYTGVTENFYLKFVYIVMTKTADISIRPLRARCGLVYVVYGEVFPWGYSGGVK